MRQQEVLPLLLLRACSACSAQTNTVHRGLTHSLTNSQGRVRVREYFSRLAGKSGLQRRFGRWQRNSNAAQWTSTPLLKSTSELHVAHQNSSCHAMSEPPAELPCLVSSVASAMFHSACRSCHRSQQPPDYVAVETHRWKDQGIVARQTPSMRAAPTGSGRAASQVQVGTRRHRNWTGRRHRAGSGHVPDVRCMMCDTCTLRRNGRRALCITAIALSGGMVWCHRPGPARPTSCAGFRAAGLQRMRTSSTPNPSPGSLAVELHGVLALSPQLSVSATAHTRPQPCT